MLGKTGTFIKLGLLALLVSAAARGQDTQDSQYKIRAKVDLVVVPVTVKGAGDKLVTGLTQQDFTVFEDGRRQTITNFTIDPVPLSAAVVIDTGLSAKSLSKVQQTFPALAGAFARTDEVALYRYDRWVTKDLDFSNDLDKVQNAMNKLRDIKPDINPALAANWMGPFSNQGPVINGFPVLPPGYDGVILPQHVPPKTIKVLNDAIFAAAADLAKRERSRRKMILVISDGSTGGSDHSFNDAVRLLLERGIQVYAVALDQPFPYKQTSVLDDYAKATGGDTYFVGSIQNIERAYMNATEEARNQYILGYISNNSITGSGPVFREINVDVAGEKLKTLHRKGYYQYP
jgi:VWFA-related protein